MNHLAEPMTDETPLAAESSSAAPWDNGHSSSSPALIFENTYMKPRLDRRRQVGSLRTLIPFHDDQGNVAATAATYGGGTVCHTTEQRIDFSSNDYLGLAQSRSQQDMVQRTFQNLPLHFLGSTGSRLLTGDSHYAHDLEDRLAAWHNRPAALLCNSGYDANLAVLSSLTMNCTVIVDELSHNSLRMGLLLSKNCTVHTFRHNCVQDLKRILQSTITRTSSTTKSQQRQVLVVVESVYSMDGDIAPLDEILELAWNHSACVVVDEAHGLGVFGSRGTGLLADLGLERHPALLASIYTFGKAAGCHGAVVCGSVVLKEYLLNYGRPIVYSTSLPLHSLVTIACSYESMTGAEGQKLRNHVKQLVQKFQNDVTQLFLEQQQQQQHEQSGRQTSSLVSPLVRLVPSQSPIQALVVPGNTECIDFCKVLWEKSNHRIRLYPIRSPTVPKGEERVRIILHSHNTLAQVEELISLIEWTLIDQGYLCNQNNSNMMTRARSRL